MFIVRALGMSLFLLLVGPALRVAAQMPNGMPAELPPIAVHTLKPHLYLVTGAHANTVLFVRSTDVVMIDTKGPRPGWA